MAILRRVLEERGILAVEAGGALAPGQSAFCAKICSKIITSQFCAVLINNDESEGREIPNANVNMEYGLMLGFNKYVIPFQRASQRLPFNVAGLDTIKYNDADFERHAIQAIDQAIQETRQDAPAPFPPDQVLGAFLLSKRTLLPRINYEGDRTLFEMGEPLGFNLLHDFAGVNYIYFGNFPSLRPENIAWRVRMLIEILQERRTTLAQRVTSGLVAPGQAAELGKILDRLRVWVLVTADEDKAAVEGALQHLPYESQVFSMADVTSELESLGGVRP
jgi:hypothetical protein